MTTLPDFNLKDFPDAATALKALEAETDAYIEETERLAYQWYNEQVARIRQFFKDYPDGKTPVGS